MSTTPAANRTSVMELDVPRAITRLRSQPAGTDQVLSVYLETTPSRMQGRAFLAVYRDRCRAMRQVLDESNRGPFDDCVRRVERYLADDFVSHQPGVALFVHDEAVTVVRLPEPPPDAVI